MATVNNPHVSYAGPTDQPGPVGPQGPPGETGPAGPPGPVGPSGAGSGRRLLRADETIYVAANGSDFGSGSQASPFKTLKKAFDFVCGTLDFGGHNVLISIGAGQFDGGEIRATVGGGRLQVNGAGSGATTLFAPDDDYGEVINIFQAAAQVGVNQLKIVIGVGCIGIQGSGVVMFGVGDVLAPNAQVDVVFETTTNMFAVIVAVYGAQYFEPGYSGQVTVIQSGDTHALAVFFFDTAFGLAAVPWVLTGTPNTYSSTAYFSMTNWATYVYPASSTVTGLANGPRFGAYLSSAIYSGDGGLTMFPGTIPGALDASSSYDGVLGSAMGKKVEARLKEFRERMRLRKNESGRAT